MANVWKQCDAKSHAERQLAAHLSSIDDPLLTLLFNVDFIPGGREIDVILIHQEIGVFILEIKGVGIDSIQAISPTSWTIENRDTAESPVVQAYRQYEGLRDFLMPHIRRLPFITVTVCLPRIKRQQWRDRYRQSAYALSIADSLIFEEDLYSGVTALMERLKWIHRNPPVRQGQNIRPVSQDFLDSLRRILEPTKPAVPTLSERERLAALERGITAKLQEDFPPDVPRRAVFTGLPGTGKTFRLLSIGIFHAYSGKRVLFVCFNKTLAADIRRLLSFSDKLNASIHDIEVLDVNQLAKRCLEMNGIGFIEYGDPDEWGELLVDELDRKESPILKKYDLVLVDEAQDMKAWQLDLLDHHATERASVIIAIGEGQELYRDAASAQNWLNARQSTPAITSHKLRRNFRNPRLQYFFAQACFDAWPTKFEKISACKERLFKKGKQEVLFDRDSSESPRLVSLPVRNEEFENHGADQDNIVSESFYDVIYNVYEHMMEDQNFYPISLLILVPNTSGLHSRAARIALNRLCQEKKIGYIDYTMEEARRASASQHQIRLCTFHSARGLEGEHVIVFGLEKVEDLEDTTGAAPQNLAFVALSRGLFSTTIAVRATPRGRVHELSEQIMKELP